MCLPCWQCAAVSIGAKDNGNISTSFSSFLDSLPPRTVAGGQDVTTPTSPRCCGQFALNLCTNTCFRPSCYNNAIGPRPCPLFCQEMCVCRGELVYNDCTEECARPDQCPPLSELQQCVLQTEPYDHCSGGGTSADSSASSNASAGGSASGGSS